METIELTVENLNKYSKQQLIDMLIEKESISKNLSELSTEIQNLTTYVKRLESDVSIVSNVNSQLQKQLVATERQCWANAQYSRRECMEISGIPCSVSDNDLEGKVIEVFGKLGVNVKEDGIEACHRIKKGSDKTIVKFSKRKDCQQVMSVKRDLRNADLSSLDFPDSTVLFFNESLCSYYRWMWSKCKRLKSKNMIYSFYTVNGIVKAKKLEGGEATSITHMEDLKKLLPDVDIDNV